MIGAEVNPRAEIEMTYPGKYVAHRSSTSIHVQAPPEPQQLDLDQSVYTDDEENPAPTAATKQRESLEAEGSVDYRQTQYQG